MSHDDQQMPQPPPPRRLRPVKASEVTMRRLRWLWKLRILLGGLTLLAGREGLGKSTVAVDITAQVTRGVLAGEHHGTPHNVIYVDSEDARDYTIVPRLVAAGADLDRVIFLDAIRVTEAGESSDSLVLPLDTDLLAAAVVEHDAVLVVLDAATSVIDGRLDGDKDRQMRQGLEAIAREVGERTGAAVLGIVHFGKRESSDTGKLILGSIAWSQVTRSTLAVARDDDTGNLVISATKANLAPGDTPSLAARIVSATITTSDGPTSVGKVEWLGETDHDARDLLGGGRDPNGERTEVEAASEWLREYLTEQRAKSADAKKAAHNAGFSDSTLARARQKLRVTIADEGFPRATYWSLPDGSGANDNLRACGTGTTGTTGSDLHKRNGTTGTTGDPPGTTVGTTGTTGSNLRKQNAVEIDNPSRANTHVHDITAGTTDQDTEDEERTKSVKSPSAHPSGARSCACGERILLDKPPGRTECVRCMNAKAS